MPVQVLSLILSVRGKVEEEGVEGKEQARGRGGIYRDFRLPRFTSSFIPSLLFYQHGNFLTAVKKSGREESPSARDLFIADRKSNNAQPYVRGGGLRKRVGGKRRDRDGQLGIGGGESIWI